MKVIELYLHGLKWKNMEISDREFTSGIVHLDVLSDNYGRDGEELRSYEAIFHIRQCSNVFRQDKRVSQYGNDAQANLTKFRQQDIPIDSVEHIPHPAGYETSTLYLWYRANCEDPQFFINEAGDLSVRESAIPAPEVEQRFTPHPKKEPVVKSMPVPTKKLNHFYYIDLS